MLTPERIAPADLSIADHVDDVDTLVRAALKTNQGWNSVYGDVDPEQVSLLRRALELSGDNGKLVTT